MIHLPRVTAFTSCRKVTQSFSNPENCYDITRQLASFTAIKFTKRYGVSELGSYWQAFPMIGLVSDKNLDDCEQDVIINLITTWWQRVSWQDVIDNLMTTWWQRVCWQDVIDNLMTTWWADKMSLTTWGRWCPLADQQLRSQTWDVPLLSKW